LGRILPKRFTIIRDEVEVVVRVEGVNSGGRSKVGSGIVLKPAGDVGIKCGRYCIEEVLIGILVWRI